MSSELSFRERERACTQDLQRSKKKMFFMPYGVVCNLPYIDGWMGGHFCILKLVSRKSCQHINKKPLCPYNLVDFTLKNCGGRS